MVAIPADLLLYVTGNVLRHTTGPGHVVAVVGVKTVTSMVQLFQTT